VAAALSISGLTVQRGGRTLLRGVSFEVIAGEIVALIGPNGAGKTTLLEAVVGLAPAPEVVRAAPLFWLPDDAAPAAELTVAHHLEVGRVLGRASVDRARELGRRLQLEPLARARCGTLSRGEARRVMLHSALCSDRPLLVLDEPLGTFDPLQLMEIAALLRERSAGGGAVLLSVHQLPDAQKVADRIVLLHEGAMLAAGTLDQLRAQAGVAQGSLEEVFLALLGGKRAA
jgi:ABC-2 type transport system ATP-binding protein